METREEQGRVVGAALRAGRSVSGCCVTNSHKPEGVYGARGSESAVETGPAGSSGLRSSWLCSSWSDGGRLVEDGLSTAQFCSTWPLHARWLPRLGLVVEAGSERGEKHPGPLQASPGGKLVRLSHPAGHRTPRQVTPEGRELESRFAEDAAVG